MKSDAIRRIRLAEQKIYPFNLSLVSRTIMTSADRLCEGSDWALLSRKEGRSVSSRNMNAR